ncbi:hypothetical protein AB1N83_014259, partial [Pleurotus pulmonarius]
KRLESSIPTATSPPSSTLIIT